MFQIYVIVNVMHFWRLITQFVIFTFFLSWASFRLNYILFLFFFRILRSMDLPCSFKDPISSKICGKDRTSDDRVIPVSQCQRNILNHLLKYNISKENIQTEADLLRLRGGFFDETNVSICPVHRAEFGTQWRRSSFCMVKAECQKRDSKRPYKALTISEH